MSASRLGLDAQQDVAMTIRLSESGVHDVVAPFLVYDVLALNN
jgi:hypothetical protein